MHFALKTAMASALALGAAAPVAAQPYSAPAYGSQPNGSPYYGSPYRPTDQELSDAQIGEAGLAGWNLRAGSGCEHCRRTGYKGRKAIAEVLVLDDALRELIAAQAPVSALKERAARNGMRSLRASGLALVAAGETTVEEFLRVAG